MIHIECDHEGSQVLALDPEITSLNLGDTNATDDSAKTLALNTTLTSLGLWRNNITAEGARALALNTTLTYINFGNGRVGNEGAKALSHNTTLTRLYIWHNNINDEGAKALALNTTLTSLDLDDNNITDESAKALSLNTTLTHLSIVGTYISEQWRMTLMKQRESNERHLYERRDQFIRCLIILARDANSCDSGSFWHYLPPDMRRYIIDWIYRSWSLGISIKEARACASYVTKNIIRLNKEIREGIPLIVVHHKETNV